MAIRPVQQNPSFFQEHEPQFKQAAEVGLAILTSASSSHAPFQNYWATRFVERSLELGHNNGIFLESDPQVSTHDLAIYSCVLCVIRPFIPYPWLFSLLSSPTVVRKLINHPLFQKLRSAVYRAEFGEVKAIIWNLLKDEEWIPELTELQERGFDWQQHIEPARDMLRRRRQIAEGLVEDIQGLARIPSSNEVLPFIEETTNRVTRITSRFGELTEISLYPLFFGGGIVRPTLYPRIMTAWELGAETHPALAPLLFISRTPDLAELTIRAGGMAVAYQTNSPLLSIIATEIALRMTPLQLKNHAANQRVLASTQNSRRECQAFFKEISRSFHEALREAGASERDIKRVIQICSQLTVGTIYGGLASEASPLLIAFYTTYFCSAVSVLLAHQGISDGSMLVSNSGLESIPLKFAIGLTFTLLGLVVDRPGGIAALTAILSLPMVIDHAVTKKAFVRFMETMFIPNLQYALRMKDDAFAALQMGCTLVSPLASGITGPLVNAGKYSLIVAGGTFVITKGREILAYPQVQEVLEILKKSGTWCFNTMLKYNSLSLLARFTGIESAASIIAIAGEPKDLATAAVVVIGVGVGLATCSPTATAIAVEAAKPVVRSQSVSGFFQRLQDKIWDKFDSLLLNIIPAM